MRYLSQYYDLFCNSILSLAFKYAVVNKGANFTIALYCHHFGSRDVSGKIGQWFFPIGDAFTQPYISHNFWDIKPQIWRIEWSHDLWRHLSFKGQGRDRNMYGANCVALYYIVFYSVNWNKLTSLKLTVRTMW